MINWERLTELRDDIGEDDFADVVEIFLEEVDEAVEGLSKTAGSADLAAHMHMLKGSALNLGFDQFGTMCSQAEQAFENGQGGTVDLAGIRSSYRASREAFLSKVQQVGS